jgi:hypothetical protein
MKARRGITVLVASIVAVVITLAATAVAASADPAGIPTGTPLRLINYNSFKCVQPVAGNGLQSWDNGAPIQQLTCGNNVPNYWTAYEVGVVFPPCTTIIFLFQWCGDDIPVYQFVSNFSGKCLVVSGASTAPWAPLTQSECYSWDFNTWWLPMRGQYSGTYIFSNVNSNLCLDIAGASTGVGATVQQWTCTDHNVAQNFFYTP